MSKKFVPTLGSLALRKVVDKKIPIENENIPEDVRDLIRDDVTATEWLESRSEILSVPMMFIKFYVDEETDVGVKALKILKKNNIPVRRGDVIEVLEGSQMYRDMIDRSAGDYQMNQDLTYVIDDVANNMLHPFVQLPEENFKVVTEFPPLYFRSYMGSGDLYLDIPLYAKQMFDNLESVSSDKISFLARRGAPPSEKVFFLKTTISQDYRECGTITYTIFIFSRERSLVIPGSVEELQNMLETFVLSPSSGRYDDISLIKETMNKEPYTTMVYTD